MTLITLIIMSEVIFLLISYLYNGIYLYKTKYFNTLWNLGLLFIFVILLGIILVYKKNTKLTDKEKKEKHENEKKYVLEKIKSLQQKERQKQNEIITNLPKFESNFVMLHKNYYKI